MTPELWITADQGEATHCAASVYGTEYVPVKRVPFDEMLDRGARALHERCPQPTPNGQPCGACVANAAWFLKAALGEGT